MRWMREERYVSNYKLDMMDGMVGRLSIVNGEGSNELTINDIEDDVLALTERWS